MFFHKTFSEEDIHDMKKIIIAAIAAAGALTLAVAVPTIADMVQSPTELSFEEKAALELYSLQLAGQLDYQVQTPQTFIDPSAKDPEFEQRAQMEALGGNLAATMSDFEARAAQELAARAPK